MFNLLLDSSTVLNDSLDALFQIKNNTFHTAENTKFGIIAGITFVISVATLFVALLTYRSQRATQNNTARLNLIAQRRVILGITKHLYRNLVDLFAIRYILDGCHYTGYPSEVHLSSMRLEIENIKNYFFVELDDYFINQVIDMVRHFKVFNQSLDIYINHLKDINLDTQTKKEDLTSMMNQMLYLISCTGELAYLIDGKYMKKYKNNHLDFKRESLKKIYDYVIEEANNINEFNHNNGVKFMDPYDERLFFDVWSKRFGNFDLDEFKPIFIENVLIAGGSNIDGAMRIPIIPFPQHLNNKDSHHSSPSMENSSQ